MFLQFEFSPFSPVTDCSMFRGDTFLDFLHNLIHFRIICTIIMAVLPMRNLHLKSQGVKPIVITKTLIKKYLIWLKFLYNQFLLIFVWKHLLFAPQVLYQISSETRKTLNCRLTFPRLFSEIYQLASRNILILSTCM